jgi:hypothetical protein
MPVLELHTVKASMRGVDQPFPGEEDASAWDEWRELYLDELADEADSGPVQPRPHIQFLRDLADLSAMRELDKAIAIVIDFFNDRLNVGDFRSCDSALAAANQSSLPAEVSLAFLAMTLAAKSELAERVHFVQYLEQWLELQAGRDEARSLLQGLE